MSNVYDCAKQGHIWLEEGGKVYMRHRGRQPGKVAVHCAHCPATAEMEAHGKFTGRGVGKAIPAPFMKVVESALVAAGKDLVPTSARPEADRHQA